MFTDQYQRQFFEEIREKLPEKNQLVNIVSELLHLHKDAVYRRVRGNTPLTMEEIKILEYYF